MYSIQGMAHSLHQILSIGCFATVSKLLLKLPMSQKIHFQSLPVTQKEILFHSKRGREFAELL